VVKTSSIEGGGVSAIFWVLKHFCPLTTWTHRRAIESQSNRILSLTMSAPQKRILIPLPCGKPVAFLVDRPSSQLLACSVPWGFENWCSKFITTYRSGPRLWEWPAIALEKGVHVRPKKPTSFYISSVSTFKNMFWI
jgi:hypothetical protein